MDDFADKLPYYTPCSKKVSHLSHSCLIITLANVDRFSEFFHQVIRKKILFTYHKDFRLTCSLLLHYLVKVENPKTLPNFHVEHDSYYV